MTVLLDDIGDYLTAQGVVSAGWTIAKGYLPDDSDLAIALFETGGYPPAEINRENERVTFQLQVRGTRLDYVTCRSKWKEVFDALQDAKEVAGLPVLLPGVVFIQCMQQGPLALYDDKGRPNLKTNFRVLRTLP